MTADHVRFRRQQVQQRRRTILSDWRYFAA